MDKRSWPWKKKSSDKSGVEKAVAASETAAASVGSQAEHVCPSTIWCHAMIYFTLFCSKTDYLSKKNTIEKLIICEWY